MSHLLAACANDQQLISWYRSFPSSGVTASQHDFVQQQIDMAAADMVVKRC
jgi:hypothetical protein